MLLSHGQKQTDRQTDRHIAALLNAPTVGGGIIDSVLTISFIQKLYNYIHSVHHGIAPSRWWTWQVDQTVVEMRLQSSLQRLQEDCKWHRPKTCQAAV